MKIFEKRIFLVENIWKNIVYLLKRDKFNFEILENYKQRVWGHLKNK